MSFEVGQIVEHQALPELGRARVDQVTNDRLYVTFERRTGGEQKTFTIPNDGIKPSKDQSSSGFDALKVAKAPTKSRAGTKTKTKAPARTFENAWARFEAKYPKGFADDKYIKDEREPKLAAQARFEEKFGASRIQALLTSGDPMGVANAFAFVYKGMTLLHTLEWIGFYKALKAANDPRPLAVAYAGVIADGAFNEASFERLLKAHADVTGKETKWTVLTIWPFTATQRGFAFVKPLITQAAAEALGVTLNYKASPNYATYNGCVEVYKALEAKLGPLGAQDWVDLQSFLWIGWKD